jgi:cytochrome c553
MHLRTRLALMLLASIASSAVMAENAAALHARALAATCANCHGTDGRTTTGSSIPSLAGMPRDYMMAQLTAFRDGTRPATVMQQLTKGFTDAQLQSVATYFAALKR